MFSVSLSSLYLVSSVSYVFKICLFSIIVSGEGSVLASSLWCVWINGRHDSRTFSWAEGLSANPGIWVPLMIVSVCCHSGDAVSWLYFDLSWLILSALALVVLMVLISIVVVVSAPIRIVGK